MEEIDKPEKCVPLGESIKLMINNFSNIQLLSMQKVLADASFESKITQKPKENSQNVRMYFLEGAGVIKNDYSSETSRNRRRSSLMKLFDPLHSMQQTVKINVVCDNVFTKDQEKEFLDSSCDEVFSEEIVNKYAAYNLMNETLISLKSPRKFARPYLIPNSFSECKKSFKKHSEDYYCRTLKDQEFRLVSELSQNYSEYENIVAEKDRLLNNELSEVVTLNRTYSAVLSELLAMLESMVTYNKLTAAKLEDLRTNRKNLIADIKTSKEDLCTTENAFSDIYKRYETAKGMIKSFKENEEHLRKNIESMQMSLDEQNRMNKMLESQTQELMCKITTETETAKKSTDTQIMLLEVQLKKSEIKRGILEMDLKQAKSTNDKLGSTYGDLLSKFKA